MTIGQIVSEPWAIDTDVLPKPNGVMLP
ncbi:hypothetical protein AGR4A_pAt30033 [Agrobacterium tumefaciens str. B6]|uniref:Uncharacterized protein n=1 Tax=Agrobacterium tumefaciens str. B6 TaxID=1183423 RepID=A0A822VBL8_AGRTU|nr:hypothetical protein AGR4A_pAt30033 [Agrobacterium tumefaciens str. B6]